MKREELIAYDKWLTRRKWGTGEIISPEKAADLYLAEHPLPPAEGTEEGNLNLDSITYSDLPLPKSSSQELANVTARLKLQLDFNKKLLDRNAEMRAILDKQPTAEGAEEILCERDDAEDFLQTKDIWNHPRISDRTDKESYEVADLMAECAQEFATLHAQKIADKMVEKRLKAELNLFATFFNEQGSAYITFNLIIEYLKNRDSHE